ncbi:glutaminyl-peptide cyclotransferase [Chitinophaga sancti]|uniref:Glutamine cyclotransferase n=1 Tax=Chitinophaga sancti TaxID=1004 RepID=A0A1K1MVT2_9BACT|nr:glutaminyl-peptide cyclotransferase [Chitinophaga sancti]WQD63032.1 glutaminyl-peptide cyclotransferase [Chitinophaga sancti]WQG91343.1 glutaminyl-peptide cyclotransferase [Chitinophaga sancti]SFW27227.1 Glutamine cyclotransferase [Chitinophaga sancti]
MKKHVLTGLAIALIFTACNNNNKPQEGSSSVVTSPAFMEYSVVNVFPHDTSSYTEGLLVHNNELYESTGREGFSKIAQVDLSTGKAVREHYIDKAVFGEGIVIFDNKIYQLTYRSNKVFVYDLKDFKKIAEYPWPGEGWSLTHDGKSLIASTGTSELQYLDPNTLQVQKKLPVTDENGPVNNINELEYVDGFIYSNQFLTNNILKINAETGKVVAKADLTDIFAHGGKVYKPALLPDPNEDVLNGIAYDSARGSFLVTGKQWPYLFEIKFR